MEAIIRRYTELDAKHDNGTITDAEDVVRMKLYEIINKLMFKSEFDNQ